MREIKELYGFVITSKIRFGILEVLNKESPLLQSEIAHRMKKKQQDISKAVYQLEKVGLVESLTPEKRSYKAYAITELGKQVITFRMP